jgi:predicted secreted Zn-dependent protease
VRPAGPLLAFVRTAAGASAAAALPVPEVAETVETIHYDIAGRNEGELAGQMRLLGPDGFFGRLDHGLGYRYGYVWDGRVCALSEVEISLELTFRYPRWTNPDQARRRVREAWDRFYAALVVHEEGHAEIAREGAQDLAEALAGLPARDDCDRLRADIAQTARETIGAMHEAQRRYDAETGHGQTQGAVIRTRR